MRRRSIVFRAVVAVVLVGVLACVGCLVSRSFAPGALEVRVVEGGVPVAGATVGLTGRMPIIGESFVVQPPRPGARTGADGVLAYDALDAGAYDLCVAGDEFVVHVEDGVRVAGGGTTVHTVELHRGVRVRGRLLDPQGMPLADVAVRLLAERSAGGGGASVVDVHAPATTSGDGTFLTDAVEPGSPIVLAVHAFRGERAIVLRERVPAPRVGRNDVGDLRVLDTETVLRLDGEDPRDDLRVRGSLVAERPGGARVEYEFANVSLGPDGPTHVVGLPDGTLRWALYEVRLGPAPNERVVGEGTCDLRGRRRDVTVRRSAADR